MSDVARRDLCAELEKLSGWDDTVWFHFRDRLWTSREIRGKTMTEEDRAVPGYTVGYLLRKVPAYINHNGRKWYFTLSREISGRDWQAGYEWINPYGENEVIYPSITDNPEDSVSSLLIELFEEGELKKGMV